MVANMSAGFFQALATQAGGRPGVFLVFVEGDIQALAKISAKGGICLCCRSPQGMIQVGGFNNIPGFLGPEPCRKQ